MTAAAHVLVVEDEGIVAVMVEDFLIDAGYQVTTAFHLGDALRKATTLAFDAAVLDINLAGHLSYPVAAALQAREIPFVFATGYGTASLPVELRNTRVINKPYEMHDLRAALHSLLHLA